METRNAGTKEGHASADRAAVALQQHYHSDISRLVGGRRMENLPRLAGLEDGETENAASVTAAKEFSQAPTASRRGC
jgi:hypothetical protein